MKVILQRDVAKIGRRFDVVEVPDGYALNMLIPKGSALVATKENIKRVDAQKERTAKEHKESDEAFKNACAQLEGGVIKIGASANEKGHLFKGVGKEEILAGLTEKGHIIHTSSIELDTPIKEVGEHSITITEGDASATFTLVIEAM